VPTIIEERLQKLPELHIDEGGHDEFEKGHCAMELVSWLAGEKFSDRPSCTSPVLSSFLVRLNDGLPEDLRQELKPYLPRVIGTAGDGQDEARGWLAADFTIRTVLPTWLELAGVEESAKALRELPPIDAKSITDAQPKVREIRDAMYEKRSAARTAFKEKFVAELKRRGVKAAAAYADAAYAYAYAAYAYAYAYAAAAYAAAAYAAADAADAADAAAAYAAADAADAADAAYAAYAAGSSYSAIYTAVKKALKPKFEEKLGPTTKALFPAALDLLERMIDPSKAA
jgi:hypothetical protein